MVPTGERKTPRQHGRDRRAARCEPPTRGPAVAHQGIPRPRGRAGYRPGLGPSRRRRVGEGHGPTASRRRDVNSPPERSPDIAGTTRPHHAPRPPRRHAAQHAGDSRLPSPELTSSVPLGRDDVRRPVPRHRACHATSPHPRRHTLAGSPSGEPAGRRRQPGILASARNDRWRGSQGERHADAVEPVPVTSARRTGR